MANERDAQKHGQRVLVMWLCWLAMAVFLIAAGVVGFAGFADVASAPDAGPRRVEESVAAATESLPRVAARDEGAARPETETQRALAAEDARRARVRFWMHSVGMSGTHYAGSVQLHVDGAPLSPLQVENCDPVELTLPRGARHLRCDAPGCAPVECELPPPPQAWPDPIEVEFVAAANLVFDVVGLPTGWQGVPTFAAASDDHAVQLRDVCNWNPGAPVSCAFLPGADLRWRTTLRGSCSVWVVEGREPALRVGEQRKVVVDCSGIKPVRYQVVGPSAQLMPHLVVLVMPTMEDISAWLGSSEPGVTLPLTETGCFDLHGAEGWSFAIGMRGGFGELREEPTADGVRLHPKSPLVGLQWRDRQGQLVEFCLSNLQARLHVIERARFEWLLVQCDEAGPRRIRTADLPSDSDLVDLDRLPSQGLGALVVTVRGERPPSPCALQVLRADGSAVDTEGAQATTRFDDLDPGTYDVRWQVAGAPGPWVAQRVTVAAGETAALLTDWPTMVAWTGEVEGHGDASPARRFLNVRFGDHARMTDGTWRSIDAEGRFRFGLADAEQPDAVVTLRYAFMHVRAEVVSLDRERRHVVVRPPEGLRWIDLRVELDTGGTWCAHLSRSGSDLPWMMLWSREQRPIVVPPGVVLGGALFTDTLRSDVLAWFDVDGTQSPVVVRRAAGRTIEFRNAGAADRTLVLVGPRGQYDGGHGLTAEPLRLFVPDGTRGIWVYDPARPDGSRPERAIEPGDVMLVR